MGLMYQRTSEETMSNAAPLGRLCLLFMHLLACTSTASSTCVSGSTGLSHLRKKMIILVKVSHGQSVKFPETFNGQNIILIYLTLSRPKGIPDILIPPTAHDQRASLTSLFKSFFFFNLLKIEKCAET